MVLAKANILTRQRSGAGGKGLETCRTVYVIANNECIGAAGEVGATD